MAIPPGIKHGAALRLAGQGGRGFYGGPSGDIFLNVQVSYPDFEGENWSQKEVDNFKELLSK